MSGRLERLTSLVVDGECLNEADIAFVHSCLSDESEEVRCLAVSLVLHSEYSDDEIEVLIDMAEKDTEPVRLQIYNELSGCCCTKKISDCLKRAVITEGNAIAKYYALISWADNLTNGAYNGQCFDGETDFVTKLKLDSDSGFLTLGRQYALYRFGERDRLTEILAVLNGGDNALKCEAIRRLRFGIRCEDVATAEPILRRHLLSEADTDVRKMIFSFFRSYRLAI